MAKAGIFYFHYLEKGGWGIRMEEVEVDSLQEALDKAEPIKGEGVMNTHWLEDIEEGQ